MPWQQRIAIVPDGDFFHAIASGKASVVTDQIESFTEHGIVLASGETLEADVIVTATGFNLSALGDVAITIDDAPLDFSSTVTWRGMMFTGVPNLLWVFGYLRFSWTLRVDLLGDLTAGSSPTWTSSALASSCPQLRAEERDMELLPWIDPENFNAGLHHAEPAPHAQAGHPLALAARPGLRDRPHRAARARTSTTGRSSTSRAGRWQPRVASLQARRNDDRVTRTPRAASEDLDTSSPDPRSKEIHDRRTHAVSAGLSVGFPVYIDRAEGAILLDVDGNQLVDLGSGIAVTSVGHAVPEVVDAVAAQAAPFNHTCFMVTPYQGYVEVCEALNRLTPGDHDKRSALFNSGAEAIENAVKIARLATGRQAIVVFEHAYHGRTNLTMALTAKNMPYKDRFGPFAPEVYRVPTSYPFRDGLTGPEAAAAAIAQIESDVGARNVAAVLIEPIQGEGGFVVPAEGFLPALSAWCDVRGRALHRRRDPDRVLPHGRVVRVASTRASSRTSSPRPRASPRAAARRGDAADRP